MFFGCLPCCGGGGGGGVCPTMDELLVGDALTIHYKIKYIYEDQFNGFPNITSVSELEQTAAISLAGAGGDNQVVVSPLPVVSSSGAQRGATSSLRLYANQLNGSAFTSIAGLSNNGEWVLSFDMQLSGQWGMSDSGNFWNARVFFVPCGTTSNSTDTTLHGFYIYGNPLENSLSSRRLWGDNHSYAYGLHGGSSWSGTSWDAVAGAFPSCLISSGTASGLPFPHDANSPAATLEMVSEYAPNNVYYRKLTVRLDVFDLTGANGSYLPIPSDTDNTLLSQNNSLL